jgi:hypothetical protein
MFLLSQELVVPPLHHLGMFLLAHLKHRLIKLLPLPHQEYRSQGLRERSTPRMEPHPTFKRHIYLSRS